MVELNRLGFEQYVRRPSSALVMACGPVRERRAPATGAARGDILSSPRDEREVSVNSRAVPRSGHDVGSHLRECVSRQQMRQIGRVPGRYVPGSRIVRGAGGINIGVRETPASW